MSFDDPFMPPDEVWRWLPDARCVATDGDGVMWWYDSDVRPSRIGRYWVSVDGSEWLACAGPISRHFANPDEWCTTKRLRPAHL